MLQLGCCLRWPILGWSGSQHYWAHLANSFYNTQRKKLRETTEKLTKIRNCLLWLDQIALAGQERLSKHCFSDSSLKAEGVSGRSLEQSKIEIQLVNAIRQNKWSQVERAQTMSNNFLMIKGSVNLIVVFTLKYHYPTRMQNNSYFFVNDALPRLQILMACRVVLTLPVKLI